MYLAQKNISCLLMCLIIVLCCLGSICAQDTVRKAYNDAARKAIDDGKLAAAEKLLNAAVTAAEMANRIDPVYVDSLSSLARLKMIQGKLAEGDAIALKALQLAESSSLDVSVCLEALAQLKGAQGLFNESASLFRRLIEINEQAEGLEGPNVCISLNNLSVVLLADAKYVEGEAALRRAITIEQKTNPESEGLVASFGTLAACLCSQRRYLEAEKELSSAMFICDRKRVPVRYVQSVKAQQGLVSLHRFDFEKAANLCHDLLKSSDPSQLHLLTSALGTLISSQWALGRDADARQQIKRLVQLEQEEESDIRRLSMLILLCKFEITQKNFNQALKYAQKAIGVSITTAELMEELYWQLALLHDIQGDKKISGDYLTKAIEFSRSNSVDGDPDYLNLLAEKVDTLLVAGRHREAEVAAAIAWAALKDTRGVEHVDTVEMMKKRSQSLRMQDRVQEADVWNAWSEKLNKVSR